MADQSKIEWTDSTFNPWIGCTSISPACLFCYAEVSAPARALHVSWGPGRPRYRTAPSNWSIPHRWNRNHASFFAAHGRRRRVFCASLADVFDNEVDPQWRLDLFALIHGTPNLDWLVLTKRIGNVLKMLEQAIDIIESSPSWYENPDGPHPLRPLHDWLVGWARQDIPPTNVRLGATLCNQDEADRDIAKLFSTPAHTRFLSMEPLLGHVDLAQACANYRWLDGDGAECVGMPRQLDWVIVGGESGHAARPMNPAWARSLRDQCARADVPFMFKQWGEWLGGRFDRRKGKMECQATVSGGGVGRIFWTNPGEPKVQLFGEDDHYWTHAAAKVGKNVAGRVLDGRQFDGYPRGDA